MKQKSKEGFSLVEMLIALAASSIVMLAIMMIMGFCTSTMRRTQQRVDLQEQAKDAIALIEAQRPVLADGLRALGLRVIEGRANYLLFRAPEALGEALRRKGAVLRSCGNYPGLDASWYRTAVRTENENRQLLALLAETLPEVAQ